MAIDRKVVIFGAGASGRGHVGQLADASGYQLVFVDVDESLVSALRAGGQYTVHLIGDAERDVVISGFRTYHLSEEEAIANEIASCDLVLTAVTAEKLPGVAGCLAHAIMRRADRFVDAPLNVIACENMINGSTALRGHALQSLDVAYEPYFLGHVGFPDAMIARVVPAPEGDRMSLLAEDHNEWPVDRKAFLGPDPGIAGLELVDNLQARLERKIYMHNTGHAVCGYLGYLKGYQVMCDAIQDPWIRQVVHGAMSESGLALNHKFGFSREIIEQYRDSFFPRVAGRLILDPVARVIRSPKRKLGRKERLIGPACMAINYELEFANLALGIAALLSYQSPDDPESVEIQRLLKANGLAHVLREVGGVDLDTYAALLDAVQASLDQLPSLIGRSPQ